MSHSSRKRGAPQVARDPARYLEAFQRQYRLLVSLGAAFDNGDGDAVYPLSTSLRTLLSDPPLLNKVLKLKTLRLIDRSSQPDSAGSGSLGYGVTRMVTTAGTPGGTVVPALDDPDTRNNPDVVFRDWWDRDLAVHTLQVAVTRKYVVTEMANTDGGSHVDASLDADYMHLLSQSAAIQFDGAPTAGSVATAAVRHIAWELQTTLERHHRGLLLPLKS